jgi:hypothetical protein
LSRIHEATRSGPIWRLAPYDISELLVHLGVPFTGLPATLTRAATGLLMAAGNDRLRSVSIWFTASTVWLMLFNPMTETNSYVILAPVFAWWIRHFAENEKPWRALALAILCLSMPLVRNVVELWIGGRSANTFADAFFPSVALVLTMLAGRDLFVQFSSKSRNGDAVFCN